MGYLLLFDALETLPQYDEALLAERVAGQSFEKHISTTRNRLFNQILRSQRVLHAGRSVDSQLRTVLEEVELLYQRTLYKAAEKKIRKSLKLAQQFEKESMVLDLLDWQWRLNQKYGIDVQKKALEKHLSAHSACLDRISEQNHLKYQFERARMLVRLMPNPRQEEERKAYQDILDHAALKNAPSPASVLASIYFQLSHSLCRMALGAPEQAYHHLVSAQEIWKNHPTFIAEYTDLYLASINIFANVLFMVPERLSEFPDLIAKMRNVPRLEPDIQIQIEWVTYHHELIYAMNFRRPVETTELARTISTWISKSGERIPPANVLGFYYNFAAFFFVQGTWEEANRWVIRILHFPEGPERQDIRDFARLFQTILQYEMGNYDLNEYLVRSTYRYMTRNRRYHTFEKAILRMINRSLQARDEEARMNELLQFQEKVVGMMHSEDGKQLLGLREVYLWSIARLQKKPIRTVFQEILQVNQEAGPGQKA